MPEAVEVTKRHFTGMRHVGDVTKLDGAALPPATIIAGGSPCQGLSVAGARRGLEHDKRSRLFVEMVRVIDEMREATNGVYPKYVVWENVPGAFNSGKPKGADFAAVLSAFTKADVSIPESGRWANAGLVRGHGVSVAWRVLNAAGWGVPQRRKRIFLGGRRWRNMYVTTGGKGVYLDDRDAAEPAKGWEARPHSANLR